MFPITARYLANETGLPLRTCEVIVREASGGAHIGRNHIAKPEKVLAVLNSRIEHEGQTQEGRQDLGSETVSARQAAEFLRKDSRGSGKQGKSRPKPRLKLVTHEPDLSAVRDIDLHAVDSASFQEMERSSDLGA